MTALPIPFPGALVLFSTSPEPAPRALLSRLIERRSRPGDDPVRLVLLQTPLASPDPAQVAIVNRQFSGHGVPIETQDGGLQTRHDAADPAVIARIDRADLVLVTGGNPERMAAAVKDTPAEDALRRVVLRGGIVGGGSAGAMIWSRALPAGAASAPSGIEPLLGWLPGLVVAPHFGLYPIAPWRALFPDATILGLPDGARRVRSGGMRADRQPRGCHHPYPAARCGRPRTRHRPWQDRCPARGDGIGLSPGAISPAGRQSRSEARHPESRCPSRHQCWRRPDRPASDALGSPHQRGACPGPARPERPTGGIRR